MELDPFSRPRFSKVIYMACGNYMYISKHVQYSANCYWNIYSRPVTIELLLFVKWLVASSEAVQYVFH